jgi:hypothetical protein
MEISTFELLAKPIAPLNLLPPELDPVARRIVQGYFLTITNLEAFSVLYRIQFTVSLPSQPNPNKTLLDNAVIFLDSETDNSPLSLLQNSNEPEKYHAAFVIGGRKTASFQLLPKLPDVLAESMLEVRGFVSLFKLTFFPGFSPPVKVLLNPEIRGTFLPNDFATEPPSPPNPDLDFDQINYTLAIASGKGLNLIPVEPFRSNFIPPIFQPLLEELSNGTLDLDSLEADNPEKARMLVQLLAELGASNVNLKDLYIGMGKLDIPVRMSSI